ncbi:MAG: His/Gly/Thr/Pro-type tRNA ligase C-terminal domain-containing protein, partial [Pseudomonadota bacterium]
FRLHEANLSEDSKARLSRNPMRILDSKDEGDRKIVADAPKMADYLSDAARDYFTKVTAGLTSLAIKFTLNDKLVRGLDYYNHTVFEFTTDMLGSQGTVLAGGRYDGLIELMGGNPTPGIGFAAGIERLIALVDFDNHPDFPKEIRPIAVIPLGEAAESQAIIITEQLRSQGFSVDTAYRGNLKNRMKKADKAGAIAAIIIGEEELAQGIAIVKDLDKGEQQKVVLSELAEHLLTYKTEVK